MDVSARRRPAGSNQPPRPIEIKLSNLVFDPSVLEYNVPSNIFGSYSAKTVSKVSSPLFTNFFTTHSNQSVKAHSVKNLTVQKSNLTKDKKFDQPYGSLNLEAPSQQNMNVPLLEQDSNSEDINHKEETGKSIASKDLFDPISTSRLADHKEMIERSYLLATKRKHDEDQPSKILTRTILDPLKPEQIPNGGRTLTRFIDRLIMKGNLPLEATDFFVGGKKRQRRSQIKLKPLSKNKTAKENQGVDDNETSSSSIVQKADIIPDWMRAISNFEEKYKTTKMRTKYPVYDILNKRLDLRSDMENTFLAKWLENIDIFAKFPHELLYELGKRLKVRYLEEGEILCDVGDPANCLYIIYDGEIVVLIPDIDGERCIVRAHTGELLGRQALDAVGKRSAKLKAAKPSYVVLLYRDDYQEKSGDLRNMIRPSQIIYDFIVNHSFLKQFSETKKLAFMTKLEFRKHYKNDVIYAVGDKSDRIYLLISGTMAREIPITIERVNKWPTAMKKWEMYKKTVTYSLKIPLESGEIFGVTECIEEKPRSEKVISEADSLILTCTKNDFYEVFERYEIANFIKKAKEDDKEKTDKISQIFEVSTKLNKIKQVALSDAMNNSIVCKNINNPSQIAKVNEWKRAEDKLAAPAFKEKKIVDKSVVRKDLDSVYQNE